MSTLSVGSKVATGRSGTVRGRVMAGIACPYTVIGLTCRMAFAAGRISPVGNVASKA